jgi:hypothetical protein
VSVQSQVPYLLREADHVTKATAKGQLTEDSHFIDFIERNVTIECDNPSKNAR